MLTPNRFQMRFDGRTYAVLIDERDMTEYVTAVDVRAVTGDLPRVVLHLRPTVSWPAELDLLAHVEVAQRSDARTGPVDFLEALDPLEVERAALARTDLENVPGGATAAVLRQLAEWAHGA
jgi:hypothetical protein